MHRPGHEGYRILRASVADAPAIARIHVDVWRSAYRNILPDAFLDSLSYDQRTDLWRKVLSDPGPRHIFLAREEAGPVIGFGLGSRLATPYSGFTSELDAVYVLEAHQRRGVGSGLVHAVADVLVEEGLGSMFTWVFAENPARRFYERLGGRAFDLRTIEIAGRRVDEVGIGWDDLLASARPNPPGQTLGEDRAARVNPTSASAARL